MPQAQVPCPECGPLARILDRFTLSSTDGPIEHVKIVCPGGHALTPTVDQLWRRPQVPAPAEQPEQPERIRFAKAS